jgi:hypothetical protein
MYCVLYPALVVVVKQHLIKQILYPALSKIKGEVVDKAGLHKSITGDVNGISSNRNG